MGRVLQARKGLVQGRGRSAAPPGKGQRGQFDFGLHFDISTHGISMLTNSPSGTGKVSNKHNHYYHQPNLETS
jgi:hypothetical protein